MFEEQYGKFLEEQRRSASGVRLEHLQKDLTGEKKLLNEVLWPVLKSFDGLIMEHEIVSMSGVRIYIDVFYEPLKLAFESEGYIAHAENITRDRFSFERMRIRTMLTYGYKFIPFSWDELDKKPEACRRSVYEIIGRITSIREHGHSHLLVNEREVIRYALGLNRPIRLNDVCQCLQLGPEAARAILRRLLEKKLIKSIGNGMLRHHKYLLEDGVIDYLL
jgi:hypothetical protein